MNETTSPTIVSHRYVAGCITVIDLEFGCLRRASVAPPTNRCHPLLILYPRAIRLIIAQLRIEVVETRIQSMQDEPDWAHRCYRYQPKPGTRSAEVRIDYKTGH